MTSCLATPGAPAGCNFIQKRSRTTLPWLSGLRSIPANRPPAPSLPTLVSPYAVSCATWISSVKNEALKISANVAGGRGCDHPEENKAGKQSSVPTHVHVTQRNRK